MPITPLLAAVFGLMYLLLSIDIIRLRFAHRVSLGTADNPMLEKSVRIHANFAEYIPLSLLLFWFIETISFNSGLVFWLGSTLLVSRVAHVLGMRDSKSLLILRQLGIVGTFGVILVSSAYLIWWYLPVSI